MTTIAPGGDALDPAAAPVQVATRVSTSASRSPVSTSGMRSTTRRYFPDGSR